MTQFKRPSETPVSPETTASRPENTRLSRRAFLCGTAALSAFGSALSLSGTPVQAASNFMKMAELRGSIDAAEFGLVPNSPDDQTAVFQHAINRAVEKGRALFVPAGTYPVANLRFPSGTYIVGIPGKTRLVYQGGGGLLAVSEGTRSIGLTGLTFDGVNRPIGEHTEGLLHFSGVSDLALTGCTITGSSRMGLLLDRCAGRVADCTVTGAAEAGIRSNEATGLQLTGNVVTDCANGGIWVHRWSEGEDGTLVSGNRVERIGAKYGGTGQWGNGINVFRAHGVVISGNRITDCAFSAIRSNTGSNVQIIGNSCLRSGEVAIYSEYAFQGALIANNVIDGGTTGISIANFLDGGRLAVCSGNLIRNLSADGPYPAEGAGFGIGIAAEADTNLTGNVIEGAPRFGLLLGWGPYMRNIIASQNILRDCGTGIAVSVVEGAGQASIMGNIIQGARDGSIIGYRWTDASSGELDGSKDFPNIAVSGNSISG
ncbi:TIGR03808 family TAT-translocated repetitive protein [Roseibium litorale]|uniref:TIGR03808 family TAT-translocated repetitive protein n=1 Tax=Roseibium litorale TaxID=2803841 RepID=A0ABR9CSX8_9HYPH|nr:TIGR03808 family TAT-translocated repetitive protein [Roseibium litorale]MBD8893987.1 TIGR03808 family TAT-translocated repetitive protein [Roseibium litorale]